MFGGKSIFEETLNTFPQIVTEISLDAAKQPNYFQTAKANDNWSVTLVYRETTTKRCQVLMYAYTSAFIWSSFSHSML